MTIGSFVTKAIGIGAAAVVSYDAVSFAHAKAKSLSKMEQTDYIKETLVRHEKETRPHHLMEIIKKAYREFLFDDNSIKIISSAKNHVIETCKEFAASIVPLGLAAGAYLMSGKLPGKICAGLLIFGALKRISTDVIGIGSEYKLK